MTEDLILHVHVPGAEPYAIGDELWEQSLSEAIQSQAEIIAQDAGAELLESSAQEHRDQLRDEVIAAMTAALTKPGARYQAPDGVRYSLATRPDGES